ncbi:MAG TPA: AAA family ATPase [Candidatus Paceibacterota bacterium]
MILTLTGASGTGKTTIAKELLKNFPMDIFMVPSYTISKFRKLRSSDIPGEYKYVSEWRFSFLEIIEAFLWTVYPHGNVYGTTKYWVKKALRNDNVVYVMILTPDAVKKLNSFAEKLGYSEQVFYFYILSPSQEVLRERLTSRGDKKDDVEKRLRDCVKWDPEIRSWGVDYEFVKNDNTIESVTEEVTNCFLNKLSNSDDYF